MSIATVRPRRTLLVICLLALGVRVAAMVALETWGFSPTNRHWAAGWETGRIADHLARGAGFSLGTAGPDGAPLPTAWLAPLYPALVGGVFARLGSFSTASLIVVLLLQSVCGAATAWVIGRLGAVLGCARGGLVAALLFALSPAAINMATRIIWSTSLVALFCALLLLRLVRHARGDSRPLSLVGTGVLVGATLLTSPVPALFVGVAWAWLARGGLGVRGPAVMATAAALVIAPWMVRNERAFDALFFIKSNLGNELFIGNNPLATGEYARVGEVAEAVLGPVERRRLADLDEVGAARLLGDWSVRWIAAHPNRFLALTARRVRLYWTSPFLADWERLPLGPLLPFAAPIYGGGMVLLLALAAWGGGLLLRRSTEGWLVVLFLAFFPSAYYLTHAGTSRYRFPVVPAVCLLAGMAATSRRR